MDGVVSQNVKRFSQNLARVHVEPVLLLALLMSAFLTVATFSGFLAILVSAGSFVFSILHVAQNVSSTFK